MHIEVANNNGTKYLKLARCHRGTNSKGKKTIIKQTVLNIGPLSRFDDGQPDYLGRLRQSFKDGKPLMSTELPCADSLLSGLDDTDVSKACAMATALYETANRARNLKAEYDLATNKKVRLVIKPALPLDDDLCARLALLAGAQSATADAAYEAPKGTPTALTPFGELFLPLEGLVDVEAERTRLGKEIEKITKEIQKSNAKLGNASFVDRAPAAVVEQERARLADWEAKKAQLEAMLAALA